MFVDVVPVILIKKMLAEAQRRKLSKLCHNVAQIEGGGKAPMDLDNGRKRSSPDALTALLPLSDQVVAPRLRGVELRHHCAPGGEPAAAAAYEDEDVVSGLAIGVRIEFVLEAPWVTGDRGVTEQRDLGFTEI